MHSYKNYYTTICTIVQCTDILKWVYHSSITVYCKITLELNNFKSKADLNF